MNSWVGGLVQPFNYNNPFDPVTATETPLSNTLGLSSQTNSGNVSIPLTIDKPVYLQGCGYSFDSKEVGILFAQQRNEKGNQFFPSNLVCPSGPYYVACNSEKNFSLVGIFNISKLPFSGLQVGFAVYCAPKLRPGGVKPTSSDYFYYSYANQWAKWYNDHPEATFYEKAFSSSWTIDVYIKMVLLDEELAVISCKDISTGFFDAKKLAELNKDFSAQVTRRKMYYYSMDAYGVSSLELNKNNNTFDFSYKNSYLGFSIDISDDDAQKILSGELDCSEQIGKFMAESTPAQINYGDMTFDWTRYYARAKGDKNDSLLAYLDWCNVEMGGSIIAHVNFNIGQCNIALGFLYNKENFYLLGDWPKCPTKVKCGQWETDWYYPMGYAYHGLLSNDSGNEYYYTNYAFAYCWNRGQAQMTSPFRYKENFRNFNIPFLGASYNIGVNGKMFLTLPGAAPTSPMSDPAVSCYGGAWSIVGSFNDQFSKSSIFNNWPSPAFPVREDWLTMSNLPNEFFYANCPLFAWAPPIIVEVINS